MPSIIKEQLHLNNFDDKKKHYDNGIEHVHTSNTYISYVYIDNSWDYPGDQVLVWCQASTSSFIWIILMVKNHNNYNNNRNEDIYESNVLNLCILKLCGIILEIRYLSAAKHYQCNSFTSKQSLDTCWDSIIMNYLPRML